MHVVYLPPEKAEEIELLLRNWDEPEVQDLLEELRRSEYAMDLAQRDLFEDLVEP